MSMKVGDRIRKRGQLHLGTIEKIAPLGLRIKWDAGVHAKIRPLYCAERELELI